MRPVDHSPADRQHAGIGLHLERSNNLPGIAYFFVRRRERGVYDRDLGRVDGELAGKALAARGLGFRAQTLVVLEVCEDAIDRLDSGGDSSGETQGARQLVGEAEFPVRVV